MNQFLPIRLFIVAVALLFCWAIPASYADSGGSLPQYDGSDQIEMKVNDPISQTLSVSGEKPMVFEAENLPPDLAMDLKSGTITGKATKAGTYKVMITISNKNGSKKVELTLTVKE